MFLAQSLSKLVRAGDFLRPRPLEPLLFSLFAFPAVFPAKSPSVFSVTCELVSLALLHFSARRKVNFFLLNGFRTLSAKTPGVGGTALFSRPSLFFEWAAE